MAQTVCYVVRDDAQWKIRLNEQSFGPYRGREAAVGIAVEVARLAAKHNRDGAEVRVMHSDEHWQRAWSA